MGFSKISDDEFSTLCGNQNERSILESTLSLFSTFCGHTPEQFAHLLGEIKEHRYPEKNTALI